jgi:dTDP-glucose 4,6-dehydratase
MSKRVLVTGIGGFVGSHCLEYFLENTDWHIIGIDSFRHKGTLSRINAVFDNHLQKLSNRNDFKERVEILYHDLTVPIDQQLENRIMKRSINSKGQIVEQKLDYIINIASDSAVERSVNDPISCWRNNADLIINMLEFARRIKHSLFIQVSTDEVYGEAKPDQAHHEWDVILPSNPYAASKAAQEALVISYWRSYNMPIILTNIMNMIGEWQDPEKFLPKIIQFVATDKEMPVYGDSETSIGTRFYLHAKNLADALIFLTKIKPSLYSDGIERPDRYNVCGDTEINNLDMAKLIAQIMGKDLKYKLIPSESARKGYDKRYALDGTKLKNLGWTQPISFRESVEQIVKYTLENPHWSI